MNEPTDLADPRMLAFDLLFDEMRGNRVKLKPEFVPALRCFILAYAQRLRRGLEAKTTHPKADTDPAIAGSIAYSRHALSSLSALCSELAGPVKRSEFWEIATDVLIHAGVIVPDSPDPAA